MSRKVLAVTSYKIFPPQSGGQRAIAYFYRYFSKIIDTVFAGTENNESADRYGIESVKIFGTSAVRYANLFYYFKLKKIVVRNDIDTIIIEQPYMGILGIMLQKFLKKKLIIRSHNIEGLRFRDLGKPWWRLLLYYEKTVHLAADISFFITEEDRQYALDNFGLAAQKTTVITYGTEVASAFSAKEKEEYVRLLKQKLHIPLQNTLLLFNGAFGYEPNDKALELLLKDIMPALLQKDGNYSLLICGKNIPEEFKVYQSPHIIIKGFVEDIDEVFRGAEIFVNPVWIGGGIKTKLVDALSFGACAVSFKSGTIGVPAQIAGNKLSITEDQNLEAFTEAIIRQKNNISATVPEAFYGHFYWGNIAEKAAKNI